MLSGNTWVRGTADSVLEMESWTNEFARAKRDSVVDSHRRSRALLMRRTLVLADVVGLSLAFSRHVPSLRGRPRARLVQRRSPRSFSSS